jgi:toxin ParE1/3/4
MGRAIRTSTAEADLFDIWSHIADDNLDAADKLLVDIDEAFALLAKSPNIGFAVDYVKPGVRCKPVRRNYLVLY